MFTQYLVTGATGFLGRRVTAQLLNEGKKVGALVLKGDPLTAYLPGGVDVTFGDVCDDEAVGRFFSGADSRTCVIHCAGIVSVATHPGDRIYRVNVGGTETVLRHCEKNGIGKLVYVSSVHAIPEKPKGTRITEETVFSPDLVSGDYAKSKAIATSLVLSACDRGLNASVVYPSGIIGPGDVGKGSMTGMLLSFITGKLPVAVKGGYDFVDVRDVAKGVIACAEHGKPGKGYILSGQYATVRDLLDAAKKALGRGRVVFYLPFGIAERIAPLYEKRCLRKNRPLYFTPYSLAVLRSNGRFCRKAAEKSLGYTPRPIQNSVRDTVLWLTRAAEGPALARA